MMESIHSETYSMILNTILDNNVEKERLEKIELFNALTEIVSIKQMADWAFKWINDKTLAHIIIGLQVYMYITLQQVVGRQLVI
jgi:ribonucleoside-diphosphate reductase beta chain